MNTPKVTVLMPVHRDPLTVRLALRSILKQTLRDFECIVVENDSDDVTRDRIRSLRDDRLRVFNLPRPNIVTALNHGLERARGTYLARMDADDFAHPRRLELQAAALDRSARLGLVSSRVRLRSRLPSGGFARYVDWQNRLIRHRQIALGRFVESPLVHPSVMIRTALLREAGGYRDGNFPEDYDLWLRLLAGGAVIRKLPETLLVWRDHGSRLTRTHERYFEDAFHSLKAPHIAAFVRARIHSPPEKHPRSMVVWGAGKISRRYSRNLTAQGLEIAAYIDIDPRKIGRELKGRPVLPPEALRDEPQLRKDGRPPFVVSYVPGDAARALIEERLRSYDLRAGRDYIMAA